MRVRVRAVDGDDIQHLPGALVGAVTVPTRNPTTASTVDESRSWVGPTPVGLCRGGVIDHARPLRRTDTAMIGIVDLQRCADHGGGGVGAAAPLPAAACGCYDKTYIGRVRTAAPESLAPYHGHPARACPTGAAGRIPGRPVRCDQVHLGPLQG